MTGFVRTTIVSVFAGATAVVGMAAPASAATQIQDGLVKVAVGDISILNNADIGDTDPVRLSVVKSLLTAINWTQEDQGEVEEGSAT